jgi:hypothetical protein
MASVLKVLFAFLHKLCLSGNYIKRFAGRWALFLAFLARRLSLWLLPWYKDPPGTSRWKPIPTETSSPCARANTHTVSRGSTGLRKDVLAGSTVPASASLPSLQEAERATGQPETVIPSGGVIPLPAPVSFLADRAPSPISAPDGRTPANQSSRNLSVHSRASEVHNIITHLHDSLHRPVDQPSQLRRETHRNLPGDKGRRHRGQDIDRPDLLSLQVAYASAFAPRLIPAIMICPFTRI